MAEIEQDLGTYLYDLAEKEIPKAWYETWLAHTPMFVAFMLLSVNFSITSPEVEQKWRVISATIYILGAIADKYSTQKVVTLVEQVRNECGLELPLSETHPLLPARLSSDEFDKVTLADMYDYALAVLAVVIPHLGVAIGVNRFLDAYLGNNRIADRIKLVMEKVQAGPTQAIE